MTQEQKDVAKNVMRIMNTLWDLQPNEYNRLVDIIATADVGDGPDILYRLKERCMALAEGAGFLPECGVAVLEYAALLKDLGDNNG